MYGKKERTASQTHVHTHLTTTLLSWTMVIHLCLCVRVCVSVHVPGWISNGENGFRKKMKQQSFIYSARACKCLLVCVCRVLCAGDS